MSTNPVGSSSSSGSTSGSTAGKTLTSLTSQDFMNMLVAELQNQDPTNPMSNSELMSEVSQIGTIQSQANLTSTLKSMLLGQNVTSAGILINRTVTGKDGNGNSVTGNVDSVSIAADGSVALNVGKNTVPLANVMSVQPTASAGT